MPSHVIHDLWTAATDADARHAAEFELSLLRDVLKMLPAGVTVQDQHGDFLLINDAAASQLGIGGNSRASARSPQLSQRGESGLASLRSGRPAILEECINEGQDRQVLLTAHRPVSTPSPQPTSSTEPGSARSNSSSSACSNDAISLRTTGFAEPYLS